MLPIGEVRRISPTQDSDLFHATIGGLGLTGIIVQAAIQGIPVLSNAVDLTRRRIANFDGFLEAFSGPAIDADYSVGWIDGMARGRNLGRGYIEFANAAPESIPDSDRRAINVPIYFPNFALNKLSIGAFNTFIYQQSSKEGSDSRIGFNRFFFPLDRIHNWNRIYGRAGFYQLQCLLPHGQAEAGIPRLLEPFYQ
jgi:decaprenylphospho-beta-D-ribofuranose 2-oxidase